jgi:hypothetical protein
MLKPFSCRNISKLVFNFHRFIHCTLPFSRVHIYNSFQFSMIYFKLGRLFQNFICLTFSTFFHHCLVVCLISQFWKVYIILSVCPSDSQSASPISQFWKGNLPFFFSQSWLFFSQKRYFDFVESLQFLQSPHCVLRIKLQSTLKAAFDIHYRYKNLLKFLFNWWGNSHCSDE